MEYKGKTVYSSGDIANMLGFDDYHRVSNYLSKIKAKNVIKQGNTRYFDDKVKDKAITYFKSLSTKDLGDSKKDKLIEELRSQLHAADQEKNARLEEQKATYERLIQSKDESISTLKESYEDLKNQLAVKDNQIESLTKLTTNAQTLNLLDKPKENSTSADNNTDTSNKGPSNEAEVKQHWWSKIF